MSICLKIHTNQRLFHASMGKQNLPNQLVSKYEEYSNMVQKETASIFPFNCQSARSTLSQSNPSSFVLKEESLRQNGSQSKKKAPLTILET